MVFNIIFYGLVGLTALSFLLAIALLFDMKIKSFFVIGAFAILFFIGTVTVYNLSLNSTEWLNNGTREYIIYGRVGKNIVIEPEFDKVKIKDTYYNIDKIEDKSNNSKNIKYIVTVHNKIAKEGLFSIKGVVPTDKEITLTITKK